MGWEKNGGMWKVMVGYMVLQDVWVFWRWCGLQDRIVVGCWPLRFLKPCIHTHLCKFHSNHTLDFLYRNGIPGCFPWLLFSFNVFPTFPSSFLWLRCGTVGLHDIPTLISREFEFSWFSLWLPHPLITRQRGGSNDPLVISHAQLMASGSSSLFSVFSLESLPGSSSSSSWR